MASPEEATQSRLAELEKISASVKEAKTTSEASGDLITFTLNATEPFGSPQQRSSIWYQDPSQQRKGISCALL